MKVMAVPLTLSAAVRLDYDAREAGDLMELKYDEGTFHELVNFCFFDKMNVLANKIIDEFEDEMIVEPSQLSAVLESDVFDSGSYSADLVEVVAQIEMMFREALARSTGVYFYF